jgi:SAM-dependent methyltransferase
VEAAVVHGSIQSAVAGYYDDVLSTHGPTHRGVDWSSRASQEQRFATLLEGIDWSGDPTLLDFGCGCGALAAYLDRLGVSCRYVGFDIAPAMIDAAGAAFGGRADRRFGSDLCALEPADHVIASGIFNVKLDAPRAAWMRYVGETIAMLGSLARRRLAFNMLPSVSASGLRRDNLFYADPCAVARSCAASIGGEISLREDYGLCEFTVVVSFDGA